MRLRNGTFLTLLLLCLCAFLSLSWYAALGGQKGEPSPRGPRPAAQTTPGRTWAPSSKQVRVVIARGSRKPTPEPLPRLSAREYAPPIFSPTCLLPK